MQTGTHSTQHTPAMHPKHLLCAAHTPRSSCRGTTQTTKATWNRGSAERLTALAATRKGCSAPGRIPVRNVTGMSQERTKQFRSALKNNSVPSVPRSRELMVNAMSGAGQEAAQAQQPPSSLAVRTWAWVRDSQWCLPGADGSLQEEGWEFWAQIAGKGHATVGEPLLNRLIAPPQCSPRAGSCRAWTLVLICLYTW